MNEQEIEHLKTITQTAEGYEVKDLVWKPTDNIIRGLVKCPVTGRDNFNNGFVVATWRKNGTLTLKYGGASRTDLYLIM
jgi:hypothetical protein